ncbi:acyltransferase family protein [Methylophaga pinxianii]|uniref:acyltransferase family protein n=1 Tax=Methylophaga pinxianii TaxID=2881052 RepID=UPI001CF0F723|nr:acyltransferase [Methylophaga pinxianii]MCB2425571.1 acyltransferase [Methylophaga pinxianii]UPH45383.1 acyltransferase [Methylophaga pinxianii]
MLSELSSGRENNLSLMRLVGALFVLLGHSFILISGPGGEEDPISELIRPYMAFNMGLPGIGVSMFFVISGFLVTKSFLSHKNLLTYLEARILRIVPALFVAVLFCVFIVGLYFTHLETDRYLTAPSTWSYLLKNASLLETQFRLPGVFTENRWPGINGSLWTLPIEFRLYLYVAMFGILGFLRSRVIFNSIVFLLIVMYAAFPLDFPLLIQSQHARLVIFFIIGAFMLINASKIQLNFSILGVFICITAINYGSAWFDLVFSITFSYLILLIAYHPLLKMHNIERYGDYSYGMYIYAFPVQQSVIALKADVNVYELNLLSFPVIAFLSFLSWHLIEKKSLRLKGLFSQVSLSFYMSKLKLLLNKTNTVDL